MPDDDRRCTRCGMVQPPATVRIGPPLVWEREYCEFVLEKKLFGSPGLAKWTARRIPPPLPGYILELKRMPVIREKVFTIEARSREEHNEKVTEALADLVWEMCQEGWEPDDTAVPMHGPVRLVRYIANE